MSTAFSILLVDDEPATADLLDHALHQQFPQANLIYVASTATAYEYLADEQVQRQVGLILVDIDLKGEQTGLDLAVQLRQRVAGYLIPIVVLSNSSPREWLTKAYESGINAYTLKPVTYEGWKQYAEQLRTYWWETVTAPQQLRSLR